jgi:nucleotide-binding universal stress UspA family protein
VTRFEQSTLMWCDGSAQSRRAVPASTLEAAARGTGLVLLVVAGLAQGAPDGHRQARHPVAEQAVATAEQAVASAVATNPSVPLEVVHANAASSAQLAELARRTSLVVMGAARHQDGDVWPACPPGDALAGQLDCPVLFVDRHEPSAAESVVGHEPAVVAGVDMVRASEQVLLTAAAEAVIRGVGLTLVHALDHGATLDPGALAQGWERCRASLRSADLPRGVPNRLVVSQEEPVAALRNRVGPRDLLVVGTGGDEGDGDGDGAGGGDGSDGGRAIGGGNDGGRASGGGGGWARAHLGPVTRGLLAAMPCDVMLVPPWQRTKTFADLGAGRLQGHHRTQPDAIS